MKHTKVTEILFVLFAVVFCFGPVGLADPLGTAFTYQGRLIDANKAADGLYDFKFKLFDADSNGNKLGWDNNEMNIDVIDGYFTVLLDFGFVFNGNARWLEIGVRPGAQNDPNIYTTLSPRQQVTPVPYAIYTLGSTGFWQPNGSGIFYNGGNVGIGRSTPYTGLELYGTSDTNASTVQIVGNGVSTLLLGQNADGGVIRGQGGGNTLSFWTGGVSDMAAAGSGTERMRIDSAGNVGIGTTNPSNKLDVAGDINAASVYKIGGYNVLSLGVCSIFVGPDTGTTGNYNSFVGYQAGKSNINGYDNTFSGARAGYSNTTGNDNVFIGEDAGCVNTTGAYNVYLGREAGSWNIGGIGNTYLGAYAGQQNQTGSGNVFIGGSAGAHETGSNKLYIANNTPGALIYGDFSANTLGFGTTTIQSGHAIDTWTGAYLSTGGAWTNNSSRNLKENITPVDARQVLEKLVSVPVSTWNYKIEDQCNRHVGPMAQDFYEAFGLNDSDTSIATIDADGISLAAIQGLYQIVKEENAALKKENEEIKARLAAMESIVAKLSQQKGDIK
ncbi:MAG: tail fiber domain-containing protein [Sedimentisphaerales bacterium]|jgi:hypothetical protein